MDNPRTIANTTLYAFGSNGSGQLGVGHTDDLNVPTRCLFRDFGSKNFDDDHVETRQIKMIVAGGNHTLVLTLDDHSDDDDDDGEKREGGGRMGGMVYAAGNNSDGRCGGLPLSSPGQRAETGRENQQKEKSWTVFTPLEWALGWNVTHVAATWEASFFVKDRKYIYVCGSGSKGELGAGEDITNIAQLRQVFDVTRYTTGASENDLPRNVEILRIHGGMNHVVVLLSNGQVFGWGSCRKGQLGHHLQSVKIAWRPVRVEVTFKVSSVTAGRDLTFLCGVSGEQLLLGDTRHFRESGFENIGGTQVRAGWSSVLCLHNSQLSGIGRNDKGQLPPLNLPPVKSFHPGSEHVLALLQDGSLVSWGWGEHGNCGEQVDTQGRVADRYNIIALPGAHDEIVGIAAGCATSFVWISNKG